MSWLDVIGQERWVEGLQERLASKALPHALLLTGDEGSNKNELARHVVQALHCQKNPKEACGTCANCYKMANNNHPDHLEIIPDPETRKIRLESIRELQARLALKPSESHCQTVIIHDADLLNIESQNSLLKILEEPPANVHFILLSSAYQNLFATIRSRCQIIRLGTPPNQMQNYYSEQVKLHKELVDAAFNFIESCAPGAKGKIPDWGKDRNQQILFVDILSWIFRDIYQYLLWQDASSHLIFKDHLPRIHALANRWSVHHVLDALNHIHQANTALDQSMNVRLVMDELALNMGIKLS